MAGDDTGEWPCADLPAPWCWVNFTDFFSDYTDSLRKVPQNSYKQDGPIAVVDQGASRIGGFTDDLSMKSQSPLPAVVFGDHTRAVKYIDLPFAQGADGVRVLAACGDIEPAFAYQALRCIKLPDKGYSRHFKFLKASRFPLAPLPEQRRIVAKIESLIGKSSRARDHLDHIARLVEKYKQAILAAAFRGDLCIERQSPKLLPLSEFVDSLDQGWSPKCVSEQAGSNDWGVIKTTAIQSVQFLPQENKRLPTDLKPRPGIVINAGDVLITRAGPRSRVAISCLVTENHPKLMLCDKAYRLRINPKMADPAFVTYMLNTPQCLSELEVMKTGISDSGLNLTQAKFMALALPAFSLPEQFEIIRRIQSAFTWIDRLTANATSARKLIDHLDQSVLAKAFKGELVPQDAADEPASALLERIRAERDAAPKSKRGRKSAA